MLRLLTLRGGIHFRKLALTRCREQHLALTTALVDGCSHTLESLCMAGNLIGASTRGLCPRQ